jgi:NAD(P)H-hydrate epimerase
VPAGAVLLDDDIVARLVPERAKRGHKGSFGKLLVIAGSLDYAGAGLLVCRAAGRAGAGLVTLAVPESLQPLFAAKVVEATTMALPEDDVEEVDPEPALAKILDHEHDCARGGARPPPVARDRGPAAAPAHVPEEGVARARRPRCRGAAHARLGGWLVGPRDAAVRAHARTPASSPGSARAAATSRRRRRPDRRRRRADRRPPRPPPVEWRQVVVLKGARTVIAAPDGSVAIAPFENPAMATGGTGDVLAGAIGALLAQGLAPFDAARLGVYLHGVAGELVGERIGDAGLLAGDLPDALPVGRKRLAQLAERQRSGRRLGFGARTEEPETAVTPAAATGPGAGADSTSGGAER